MTLPRRVMIRIRHAVADETGVGYFATVFTMLLAVTAVGCISLLVDGGRVASSRRTAEQIAYQTARSAAQHLDPTQLRNGLITIDPATAETAAAATVGQLLAQAGLTGRLDTLTITGTTITATVTITTPLTASAVFGHSTATVTATSTTRLATGITTEDPPLP